MHELIFQLFLALTSNGRNPYFFTLKNITICTIIQFLSTLLLEMVVTKPGDIEHNKWPPATKTIKARLHCDELIHLR